MNANLFHAPVPRRDRAINSPVDSLALSRPLRISSWPKTCLEGATMKRLEFTCDGCDLVEHMELPLDGNADFLAEGWIAHRVASEENGVIVSQVTADLCPSCSEKLRHAINPANWPRLDPTIRQFTKK